MNYEILHWYSDVTGEEIGKPEAEAVGLYVLRDFPEVKLYIDIDKGKVIKAWI